MENQNTEPNKRKWQPNKQIKPEHKEFLTKLGEKLKKLRNEKSLTAASLCKSLKISRNAYHSMEEGKVYFNIENLMLILDYYQLTATEFMNEL
jgi:DNA-binding XRE family transcriptional regulator